MNGEKTKNSNYISIIIFFLIIFIPTFLYLSSKPYQYDFFRLNVKEKKSSTVEIFIVGDMMLDRNVKNTIDKIGFDTYFKNIKDIVEKSDIAIANLEGPFTDYSSVTTSLKSKELIFTFDPLFAKGLADLGFDILGLANNHTHNFGREGLESTKEYIKQNGMMYYGDPFNNTEISTVMIKGDIKIGIIGFHEFYYVNFNKINEEIIRLRNEVDVIIVTPHWGIEYKKEPSENMVKLARGYIDSGADMVIGTHPHIVGDIVEYKGKKIYYSLGNFVFDQYFSKETMSGLGIVIKIEKYENAIDIEYIDIPINIERDGIGIGYK